jgi:GxxExxY protein
MNPKSFRHLDRLDDHTERIASEIVDSAFHVFSETGPGLLESAYEACLYFELNARGLVVQRQVPLTLTYRGHRVDAGYRMDLCVENLIVVEVKSAACIEPIHKAQLLTYMKLSQLQLGFLINFNVTHFSDAVTRLVQSAVPHRK